MNFKKFCGDKLFELLVALYACQSRARLYGDLGLKAGWNRHVRAGGETYPIKLLVALKVLSLKQAERLYISSNYVAKRRRFMALYPKVEKAFERYATDRLKPLVRLANRNF